MIKSAIKKLFSKTDGYESLNENEETEIDRQRSRYDRYTQIEKLPFEQQLDMLQRVSASPSELHAFQVYVSERLRSAPKENTKIKFTSSHPRRH